MKKSKNKPRKIMIGTPCYDGKVELDYMNSIFKTMELCILNNIQMTLKTVVGCSIIPKARNELFRLAYEAKVDDLIFIDSDQAWTQKDFGNLISPQVDVIGGAVVAKDDKIHFNVKTFDTCFEYEPTGNLLDVRAIGTGFLRFSRNAIEKLWEISDKYVADGIENRNVFEIGVRNGNYTGEDVFACDKWRDLGNKVYVHPEISVSHIGKKKWDGNFKEYVRIANENWEKNRDKSA
jgi:hypothetical protein